MLKLTNLPKSPKNKRTASDIVKLMPKDLRETLRTLSAKGYKYSTIAEQAKGYPFFKDNRIPCSETTMKIILKAIYKTDKIDIEVEYRKLMDQIESDINTTSLLIAEFQGKTSQASARKQILELMKHKSVLQKKKEELLDRLMHYRETGSTNKTDSKYTPEKLL